MYRPRLPPSSLLLLLAWCGPAAPGARSAEQPPAPVDRAGDDRQAPGRKDSTPTETIVITAHRAERPLLEIPRSLQVLDQQGMEAPQARSLADAVGTMPGVFLQKTNRGAGAPFLRGLVGPQNLILVDGIRFNNSTFRTGPNQYLALLDPVLLGGVEVTLGPASVQFGSDAMGGVLNLLPAGFPAAGRAGGRAGVAFASADLSAGTWADVGVRWRSLQQSTGAVIRRFGTLRAGGSVEQPLSDYRRGGWRERLSWKPAEDMELAFNYLGSRVRGAGRTDRLDEGRFRFYDNDDDLLWLDWRWRPQAVLQQLRLAASLHHTFERVDRYRCRLTEPVSRAAAVACTAGAPFDPDIFPPAPLYRERINEDRVLTPGLLLKGRISLLDARLLLDAGGEAYLDLVSSRRRDRRNDSEPAWNWTDQPRGDFSEGSRYLQAGAFTRARLLLPAGTGRELGVEAGLRLSHFRATASGVPGLGDVAYSNTGLVASAALDCRFRDRGLLWLGFAQGFRAPNLQESTVLGDTGSKFEVPNGALGPERSHTLELGGRLRLPGLEMQAAAFFSWLDDMISERELGPDEWLQLGLDPEQVGDKPVVQRVNAKSGRIWGAEGWLLLGPWRGLGLRARLAWLRGEEVRSDGSTVPARRIPPLSGSVGLRYRPAGASWFVEGFVDFAGPQHRLHPSDEADLRICEDPDDLGDSYADSGLPCPGTPGWYTINLRAAFELTPALTVDLTAGNLTDQRYRTHGSGLDAPGVDLAVAVRGRF